MLDLDVVSKARIVLGVKEISARGTRRPVDLLITYIIPGCILLCSFLITANKLFQKPVQCFSMPMTVLWPDYVESQCWVQGPFYVKNVNDIPEEFDESKRLTYYAYLPYIFGFSALIPFIPYFIFSLFMKNFSNKFEAIYAGCGTLSSVDDFEEVQSITDRIFYHLTAFNSNRLYITLFLVARVTYILSLIFIGIFYSISFKMNYFVIGFKSAFFYFGNFHHDVYEKFPINGMCHVSIREQVQAASRNFYNLQCNLSTNFLVSKIMGFLFVLQYFIAFPLAIFDTVNALNYFLCRGKGYNSKTLLLFLLRDAVSPVIYGKVNEAYKLKTLKMIKSII